MLVRIRSGTMEQKVTAEGIGLALTKDIPIYEVIDKRLFFLSVIKYGIVYREIKSCE